MQKCLREFKKIDSVQKAVAAKAPSISKLVKTIGEDAMEGYLYLWLDDLNSAVNVSKPLTESQIEYAAFTIVNYHRNLTLADINLIFNNAKRGKYGELYNALSPEKILKWFDDYFALRMDVCSQMSIQQHQQLKENYHAPRNSEMTVKDYVKNIGNDPK